MLFVIIVAPNSAQAVLLHLIRLSLVAFCLCHVRVHCDSETRSLCRATLRRLREERGHAAAAGPHLVMASSWMNWWIKPVCLGSRFTIKKNTHSSSRRKHDKTVDCHSLWCTTALLNVQVWFTVMNTNCFSCWTSVCCFYSYDVFSATAVTSYNQYTAAVCLMYYSAYLYQNYVLLVHSMSALTPAPMDYTREWLESTQCLLTLCSMPIFFASKYKSKLSLLIGWHKLL